MRPHDPKNTPQPSRWKSHRGFNKRGEKTHKSKDKK